VSPESLLSIAAGLALAAAAGFRVFVPLLVVSVAARAGWVTISPTFDWLATTPALITLSTATILEIGAYYVPFLDNLLDTIATPAAVAAGMLASAAVLVDLPPWLQYTVTIIGAGGTAGIVAASTSLARLKSSALTAGFGNALLATFEMFGAFGVALIAVFVPILALFVVIGLCIFAVRRVARRRTAQSL
jgi:uncharacterized protein DUF4126